MVIFNIIFYMKIKYPSTVVYKIKTEFNLYIIKSKSSAMPIKNLLVPGGLGFIGSHTVIQILQQTDCNIIIIDDLSNCYQDVFERMKSILQPTIGKENLSKRICFHEGNILNLTFLDSLFAQYQNKGTPIDGIMHFAAKKAVGQSITIPLQYFQNNFVGSLNLFKMMEKYPQCTNFIFSSTAGVYGDKNLCRQSDLKNPSHAYGQSKTCVEMLIGSLAKVHKNWKMISLRYFNPAGAHKSGLLGDQPSGYPNNLVPFIQQVIIGKRSQLTIFGDNYETYDGTCVRDYIHITDLAQGHLLAMQKLDSMTSNLQIVNLGSGKGNSVLQILHAFEKSLGRPIKHQIGERRQGDVPTLVANIDKARQFLGWQPKHSIDQICKDVVSFIKIRLKYNPQQ